MPRASDVLDGLAVRVAMATRGRVALQAMTHAAEDPAGHQRRTLRAILDAHGRTGFGRDHGYARLRDLDGFRAAVPIRGYEELRPWIDRQVATGERALTPQRPLMYARTSGTTGAPKHIPVTATMLAGYRRAQRAAAYAQHRAAPLFAGRILALVGAVEEDRLPDGTPVGSATGLIYRSMPAPLRRRYVAPASAFAIEDPELKYRLITRLALQHEDLTAVSTANPSTLLRLRDTARAHWSTLLTEIAAGTCADAADLPDDQRRAIMSAIRADSGRAAALARAAAGGEPSIGQLWPNLAGVVTWTGGGCALAAEAVADALPPKARLMEAGYVCSEFRGAVVVDPAQAFGLPLLDDVFFEFAPLNAWDAGSRDTLLIHELEEGGDYQVIVTTAGGLARYHLNDVLRAGPRIGGTPTLRFLRKGRGTTSITGEKITEDQIGAAVAVVTRRLGLLAPFHLVLADEHAAAYFAYLELEGGAPEPAALGQRLDEELRRLNLEYDAKRGTARLRPLSVLQLRPGAAAAYRAACVRAGQRDAQFKVLTLQYARECAFDFADWRVDAADPAPRR